jgi:hypothetical protein
MKPSMLDTDILSEFLRGNPKVINKVDEHIERIWLHKFKYHFFQ